MTSTCILESSTRERGLSYSASSGEEEELTRHPVRRCFTGADGLGIGTGLPVPSGLGAVCSRAKTQSAIGTSSHLKCPASPVPGMRRRSSSCTDPQPSPLVRGAFSARQAVPVWLANCVPMQSDGVFSMGSSPYLPPMSAPCWESQGIPQAKVVAAEVHRHLKGWHAWTAVPHRSPMIPDSEGGGHIDARYLCHGMGASTLWSPWRSCPLMSPIRGL
uniref:Uncharacterized protein n=1 Tax=Pelusios castaneus TaxID=367368 RepID=A0A8C8VPL9_9SAUR